MKSKTGVCDLSHRKLRQGIGTFFFFAGTWDQSVENAELKPHCRLEDVYVRMFKPVEIFYESLSQIDDIWGNKISNALENRVLQLL